MGLAEKGHSFVVGVEDFFVTCVARGGHVI